MVRDATIIHGSLSSLANICQEHELSQQQKKILDERLKAEIEKIDYAHGLVKAIVNSQGKKGDELPQ